MAFVDVGNMGESRSRVTEGGQECEQGMLGNQQVSPVSVPPCCKGRLWVTRGQVCTGNQMFLFAAASNLFLNEQPRGADSPLVISELMGVGWGGGCGGVDIRSYVNVSKNEIKYISCQTHLLQLIFLFFFSPNHSVL